MKIYATVFDYPGKDAYGRLAAVFSKSVELNCPAADLHLEVMETPKDVKRNAGMTSNWAKFKYWEAFVLAQPEGEHVVLMDVDMLVLGDLRPAFTNDFDIALTRRTSTTWPYNGGVIFLKINDRSRSFIQKWSEIDGMMYQDDEFHDPYKRKYKGQNQASLGWMVEHNPPGAKIIELPCAIWNACNEDWMRFNEDTRVVHIKSALRAYCLGRVGHMPSKLTAACSAWKQIEAQL